MFEQFKRRNTMLNMRGPNSMLNLHSNKQLTCIERIKECKTFGKFLYERR